MAKMRIPVIDLRAEFKPLLSVVNIVLEFPRSVILSSPRLTVEAHSISIETNEWALMFPLLQLTLKPSTCRGLRWNSHRELQLTFEAEWDACVPHDKLSDVSKETNQGKFQSFNEDILVSKIKACQSRCYCVGCGAQILKASCQFQRVLPLPSENWSDFADIWFCHNHSVGNTNNHSCHNHSEESTLPDNLKGVRNAGLSPRLEDCLVSSLYMLIRAKQVESSSVICITDRLVCKRCGNFLGFVKLGSADDEEQNLGTFFHDPLNGVYKIYLHAVNFKENLEAAPVEGKKVDHPAGETINCFSHQEQSIEDFMYSLLKDQSRLFTSFRFIIDSSFQGKSHSTILILLWLLDQELFIFSSSAEIPSLNSKGSLPSSPSSSLSTSQMHNVAPVVAPCKYVKVLYKATFQTANGSNTVQTHSPDVFSAWKKDNTVHGISLPYPLCKQMVSLLVSSTKQLTRSQRSLNGFHVGYLKAS